MRERYSRFTLMSCLMLLPLMGCQSKISPELKQCAQQNYQCEQSCQSQSVDATLTQQICNNQCIDEYNACKAQAEALNTTN
ncbi:hypothetical protein [Pseudoalteromonas xiamenensis]